MSQTQDNTTAQDEPQTQDSTQSQDPTIETLTQELAQMKDIAMRALADLQNFKRKAEEERSQLLNMGKLTIASELLPVLDNFKRAFQHIPENLKSDEWVKGVTHIEQQFISIVKNMGLEEVPTTGQANPSLHEVISTLPGTADTILEVLENGYTFNGKLIRPAKVITGNGQPA